MILLGIVDDPIILTIHSAECPDLTIIDLPGITRIPLKGSDQNLNVEKLTTDMASRYCTDERTIILCVIPANIDLSTSDGLKLARDFDPKGERTLGVLTKIDIMNHGEDARSRLTG
jgi:vacuolar protein sorting-associated protein 1